MATQSNPGAISTHEAWRTSPQGSSPQTNYSGDAKATIPLMNPSWQQFSQTNTKLADNFSVGESSMDAAIRTYESIPSGAGTPSRASSGQNVYTDAQPSDPNDTWRYGSPADKMKAAYAGGGGSNSSATAQQKQTVKPMVAMKSPELPEFKVSEQYAPPEEDKSVYDTARREAMGAGMRELREGTREAISSSQSLDNPNARGKFIQQALKGYGQGLEQVAKGAASEAKGIAGRARAEQLDVYKTNYQAKTNAYLINYQNQINTIAANFASQQNAQAMNFHANLAKNTTVQGMDGGSSNNNNGIPTGQDMYNQMFGGSTNGSVRMY